MFCFSILNSPSLTLIWSLLLVFSPQIDAGKVTVDDADPAIHYYQQWAQGPGCSYCWAQPDPGQAHGGTWHDAFKSDWATDTGPVRMFNYTFRGTGIAIYGIVGHGAPYHGTRGSAGASFYIDGASSAVYNLAIEDPTDPPTYQYNAMIGSQNNLADGEHVLTLYIAHDQPNFIFDYLVVTNSDLDPAPTTSITSASTSSTVTSSTSRSSSSTSASNSTSLQAIPLFTPTLSSTADDQSTSGIISPIGSTNGNNNSTVGSKRLSTGTIIGIAVGAAALGLLLLLLLLLWRKRREQRHKRFSEAVPEFAPRMLMAATLAPIEGSIDSHRTFRDVKAPLPIGDNIISQERPMNEQRKPDLPSHGQALHRQQQSMGESVVAQPAPWFQQTDGSHPVEAIQQHMPSSPPPNGPLNPSPDQHHGTSQGGWSYTMSSYGISNGTSNAQSEEGRRFILD